MSADDGHYTLETMDLNGKLARTQADIVASALRGEHFWIAVVSYRISSFPTEDMILDSENLTGPPVLMCAACGTVDRTIERCTPREVSDT